MSQSPDPDQERRASEGGTPQGGSVRSEAPAARPAPYDADPYGTDPYGGEVAEPWQHGGAHGPVPPAAGGPSVPASTIVLLVVTGALLVLTSWTVAGLLWAAPAVLAVVSLTRASADPAGAGRLTRIGWWVTAGLGVLGVLLVALLIVGILLLGRAATPSGYDSSTVGLVAALQTLATTAAR